jgi:hypothetical protein
MRPGHRQLVFRSRGRIVKTLGVGGLGFYAEVHETRHCG